MPQETDFVMGTEEECLTVAGNNGWAAAQKIFVRFMRAMADLAPALPSQNGMFNGYGKILVDTGGHIELSSAECDSPYLLAEIVDRQHQLAGQALARLEQAGAPLVLANNNHSELLTRRSNTWGSHESYLTGIAPQAFTGLILPFLVTRIYAGAGGILYPCGSFVASVRALRMNLATGGDTTGHRAIHSTARDESLMGGPRRRHRYHLISGDGHRSQFNLALQFGATALALKAIEMNDGLGASLAGLALPRRGSWPGTMRALNVLSRRGEPLRVDPLVTATQRLYLEAARRYRAALSAAPAWIDRTLRDWEDTLAALERADWPWLAARLDAFAKHALWSGVLAARGKTWESLAHDRDLLQRLALLDQSYHEFGSASSVFALLEEAGLLEHRVAAPVAPGEEEEPFVPATATRARVRARFIRENAGQEGFHVDWCAVYDVPRNRRIDLSDPFAPALGEWAEAAVRTATPRDPLLELRRRLNEDVRTAYEQGRVRQVLELLPALQEVSSLTDSDDREVIYKHRAWTTTQAGYLEGDRWLMHAYAGDVSGFEACVDHVAVRTIALCPPPDTREWIERAFAALQAVTHAPVTAGKPAARALRQGMPLPEDPQAASGRLHPFPPVAYVRAVEDGEVLRVGPLAVTAHRTPGHTPGGTTWTWRSCEGARCLDLVFADSLNP
ncbi:MAG: proteasome accessory factor PafA2 family protein, partial [Planctomycetes bacterium]|nr:proteasome accessory factor PafA2 family protein [Planctomycetota bacterium]